jgi:2-aminoadipate transaminase
MTIKYDDMFSVCAMGMKRSVIRELLKLTRNPEIISFAGGLPDPHTFPVKEISDISRDILDSRGALALQYGPTEGEEPLRQQLVRFMAGDGMTVPMEDIMVTTGSQQGLDIVGKILIDPGDVVIVELPSYLGGLQAFSQYHPEFVGIPQDDDGMQMEILEEKLVELTKAGKRIKFIYVVPDFQNPSGVTLSKDRRVRLLELAAQYNLLIVEDSPYRALRFEGEAPPTIYSTDKDGRTMYLSTFSKTFCPGFRMGWIVAPPKIMNRIVMAKQAIDLCCPSFTQLITAEYMSRGRMPAQLAMIVDLYKVKRNAMLEQLAKYMPPTVTWTRPEGGLFLWIRLPEHIDSEIIFKQAIEKKVAYVIGSAFYCDGGGKNTLRINFSFASLDQITEGVKRLADLFNSVI